LVVSSVKLEAAFYFRKENFKAGFKSIISGSLIKNKQ